MISLLAETIIFTTSCYLIKKNTYLAGQQLAIKVEWLMEPRHTAHI